MTKQQAIEFCLNELAMAQAQNRKCLEAVGYESSYHQGRARAYGHASTVLLSLSAEANEQQWKLQPLDTAPEGTVLYVWARNGRVQFCLPLDRSQLFVRRMQVRDYIEPAGWIEMPEIEEETDGQEN